MRDQQIQPKGVVANARAGARGAAKDVGRSCWKQGSGVALETSDRSQLNMPPQPAPSLCLPEPDVIGWGECVWRPAAIHLT
jgi:hypothetical protein